ncbi:hypothetical protein BAY13_17020 [Elizabethkingia bruuniana]|uniref:hypothetical protein n=1 Tax=Elizabethkingia bruuniana TaxID=1756149 RepID=UPI00099AE123|nr:hypothetical protein [Elizabethkingia bruuniana]OPC66438.1 hypothetical protein BAY13_17020 [Elizabethkingia bruuniana]
MYNDRFGNMGKIRTFDLVHIFIPSILLIIILLHSCSERDNFHSGSNSGKTAITFNVKGVTDYENIPITHKINSSIARPFLSRQKDVDIQSYMGSLFAQRINNKVSTHNNPDINLQANTTPLETGIVYHIEIYDETDTNHTNALARLDAKVGEPLTIQLDAGKKYNWYAYSTNETTIASVSEGVVSKENLKNKDLLWANGNMLAQYGENSLMISFARETARVNVEINSRGMSGIMPNNTANRLLIAPDNSLLKYGDFNIFSATYSNKSEYTMQDITPVSTYGNAVKSYTLYTAEVETTAAAGEISLSMNDTDIVKSDSNPNATIITIPSRNVTFQNLPFTPNKGNQYNLTVNLIETGITVGGVTWARSNLIWINDGSIVYKTSADPFNGYYNIDSNAIYDFFYFSTALGVPDQDYCARLYPEGIWRIPTSTDFNRLIAISKSDVKLFNLNNQTNGGNSLLGIRYALDDVSQVNPIYPPDAQDLFFVQGGYITASLRSSSHGFNRTSTASNVSIFGYYLYLDGTAKGLFRINTRGPISSNSTVSMAPANETELSYGVNVRCVRNN